MSVSAPLFLDVFCVAVSVFKPPNFDMFSEFFEFLNPENPKCKAAK